MYILKLGMSLKKLFLCIQHALSDLFGCTPSGCAMTQMIL